MIPSNWEQETVLPVATSCKQAARLVSLSFERSLSWREWLTMSVHLWSCKTCSIYRRQIKALRSIFIHHHEVLENTPADPTERLGEQAKERIKKSLSSRP